MGLQEDLAYKSICETHGWEYNPRYIEIPDAFASKPQPNWQSYTSNAAPSNGYLARSAATPKPTAPRMTDEEREQFRRGLLMLVGEFVALPYTIITHWLKPPVFMTVLAYGFLGLFSLSLVTQLLWGNFLLWELPSGIVKQAYIHVYYLLEGQIPG